jgi:beta-galactosidase GanA
MREAGMNVCRIAEFAWSSLEPNESQYQMDWLERAVTLLHDNGIAVVLGTPTAAPPAWLTHHHPDTLAIESNGRPAQHGNRCHVAPNSLTYLIINHNRHEVQLPLSAPLPNPATDLLTGKERHDTLILPGYGVQIFSLTFA